MAIQRVRIREQNVILVGAGDFSSDEDDAQGLLKAQVALEAMERMGYNALTLGRWDIKLWVKGLERARRRVPVVCTNLVYRRQRIGTPYRLIRSGTLDVALFGMISPSIQDAEWEVADPVVALQTALASLPHRLTLTVVMANMSLKEAEELSRAVPEVDVILLSSEGITVRPVQRVGVPALIVSPGDKGMVLGGLQISVDDRGSIIGWRDRPQNLGADIPDDPEMATLYRRYQEQLQRLVEKEERSLVVPVGN
jgi:2',3'-cyclic-nucleotide 2'-phosphodiesterase (5'-nucleotidase family)